jgi:hypothetical protein
LYREYARTAANGGQLLTARDVALELVGHVTAEDPLTHLLLGKLAIRLRDRTLLREAHSYLAFLRDIAKLGDVSEQLRAAETTTDWQF